MITYDQIYTQLSELLQAYLKAETMVKQDSRLVDDLGLDSVQTMEMLMDLEDRLDVSIPLNFLPEVHTVDDLVKVLENAVGNAGQ